MTEHSRILYVENNEDAFFMVSVLLEFSNIKVVNAKTVAEAWRLAHNENFDLFLLDSLLPDGNGLDLCRRLRQYAPHTPVLFYSANAFETDKQKGFEAGANAYLAKPCVNDLSETILLAIKLSKKPDVKSYRNSFHESQNKDELQGLSLQFD